MFKIFVGNLNVTTTEDALRRLFGRYAEVDDIAMPVDPETGKPRGFAIVMIKDPIRAKGAMIALRGTRLDGRALVINQARKKGQPPPPRRDRRNSSRYRARGRPSVSRSGGPGLSGGGREGGGPGRGFGSRPDFRSGGSYRSRDDRGSSGPSRPRDE